MVLPSLFASVSQICIISVHEANTVLVSDCEHGELRFDTGPSSATSDVLCDDFVFSSCAQGRLPTSFPRWSMFALARLAIMLVRASKSVHWRHGIETPADKCPCLTASHLRSKLSVSVCLEGTACHQQFFTWRSRRPPKNFRAGKISCRGKKGP